MEYQFITDPVTGQAQAKFSLEHEVFGYWLTLEVGKNTDKLTEILTAISTVEQRKQATVNIVGREYSITIEQSDIMVTRNYAQDDSELDVLNQQQLDYDQYEQASCGLEDLREILLSWAIFVK